jgi:hypothetical protein
MNVFKKCVGSPGTLTTIMNLKLITIAIPVLIISACNSKSSTERINEKLIGTWQLDSSSNPRGEFYKEKITEIITFKENSTYTREWMDYDVGNNTSGRYMLKQSPKRALATLSLILGVQVSRKDTVRTKPINFDILEITSNRLHMVTKSIPVNEIVQHSTIVTKHCIYKRVNQK